MKTLMIIFRKNGLFKKKEVMASIFLNTMEGKVTVHVPDPKLEIKIRNLIDFSKDYIKNQGIPEETSILEGIKNFLI